MNILEILFEKYQREKNKQKYHPDGTYISAQLSSDKADELFSFVEELKIPNLSDKSQYHATIIYSRKGIPDVKGYEFKTPIKAKIKGWQIFNTQTGAKCLVALLESKTLTKYHKDIMAMYDATYDFPDYHPHITVSYDYKLDTAPKEVPTMEVVFDSVRIEPLDPAFTPKKAK